MLPEERQELFVQCCEDVKAAHAVRSVTSAVVGAFPSFELTPELIEAAVKSSIDLVIKVAGSSLAAGAIALKPQVRKVVSESALEWLDSIVHGLMDAKTS